MLSWGLGLIPPLLPINSAPGAKLHEREREIRTVGKSLLYIPGLEASKRKNQTPQLFAARILGTTRKIFAKQFSVGSFALFLFGTVFVFLVNVMGWDFWWLYFDGFRIFASDVCLLQVCGVT